MKLGIVAIAILMSIWAVNLWSWLGEKTHHPDDRELAFQCGYLARMEFDLSRQGIPVVDGVNANSYCKPMADYARTDGWDVTQ